MYVTRPLSMYRRDPAALSHPPPAGPNSGFLVVLDEGPRNTTLFHRFEYSVKHLPFPQNKNLTVVSSDSDDVDEKVMFIPVLNQPLSSNRYYVIKRKGKHQGQAITSSKEEDITTCLCCTVIEDVKPRPLDPFSDYQQVEIINERKRLYAKSIAIDGIPPEFLRKKGWKVYANTPQNYHLNEALGSNDPLRAQLPDFNFPSSNDRSESAIVGKWYCPFMFVKERVTLKEQMKMSAFYEMTLHQRWEKIFSKENGNNGEVDVLVDVVVQTEVAKVAGREAVWDENGAVDRFLWFKGFEGAGISVGLSLEIVERMKWEQERVGWVAGNERQVRVERVEEYGGGTKMWNKFSCYVLVESFVLKQMNGKLVLTYDFRHTQQIRCKWE